jgi:hypothetical protein
LVAEIERLTKARKEAAKAGDEARYQELTEELKLARQAMTKLRQEQQIARIAWMQQAQTAQQLGANIRTVTEGVMNFGEAVENGTVNLTGMVSAVMSMSIAIKAGLGPLGWALLAVEALSMAWNSYAKSQKKAEEAEKKKQERIVNLTTAYHEAAAEVEKFKNAEARQSELKDLLSIYDDINARLRERNDLQEKSLRMIQAELAMQAKEDEQASVFARNDIMRAYWRGEIDEEERDSRLDSLKITQARNKQRQTAQLGKAKVSAAKNKVSAAYSAREAAGIELGAILGDGQIYNHSPEEMAKRAAAYNEALQYIQDAQSEYNSKMAELRFHDENYTLDWAPAEYVLEKMECTPDDSYGYFIELTAIKIATELISVDTEKNENGHSAAAVYRVKNSDREKFSGLIGTIPSFASDKFIITSLNAKKRTLV